MPTSGLVISISKGADLRPVVTALGARDNITCGDAISGRLPIVTVTSSKAEDQALWKWLWTLPGVASVDVALIYLGDDAPAKAGGFEESHKPRTRVQTSI